ncbi:hypothetical protein AAFF_G00278530 [Aldrovandia affinis]|uniref:Uncharacterized protein n=1 Tax=Aldrovandia affinis TaxID=143900 RepID=A0AAD7WT12_9TELE|nr:hypothetical protein AAFF_G00278530 [Aldrovandia affinis]
MPVLEEQTAQADSCHLLISSEHAHSVATGVFRLLPGNLHSRSAESLRGRGPRPLRSEPVPATGDPNTDTVSPGNQTAGERDISHIVLCILGRRLSGFAPSLSSSGPAPAMQGLHRGYPWRCLKVVRL